MLKPLLALLLVSAAVTACDSDGPDDLSVVDLTQDPALLVGSWEWVRSVVRAEPTGARSVVTPAGAGRTERVEFRADGTFAEYVDGEPVLEGPYEALRGGVHVEGASGRSWLGSFGVDEDDLILTTAPADGPTKYYRRED